MPPQDLPIVNTQKLEEIVSIYKVPLILSSVGILLFVIAIAMFIRTQKATGGSVVFEIGQKEGSSSAAIRIDVAGAVVHPGVFEFPYGSRIQDALDRAGGLTHQADSNWVEKNLNRAAKLVDGGKVYVPTIGENTSNKSNVTNMTNTTSTLGVTTGLVNINSASQAELEALPGVGPVTAGKIIAGRPYGSIEELKTKKALGDALFDKLKDLIIAQ